MTRLTVLAALAALVTQTTAIAAEPAVSISLITKTGRLDVPAASNPEVKVQRPNAKETYVFVSTKKYTEELCKLTGKHVNERVVVAVGCQALIRPVLRSAVCGGVFVIKSESPEAAAKLVKTISAGKPVCNKPIPLEPAQ